MKNNNFQEKGNENKGDAQITRRVIAAFRPYRKRVLLILGAILLTTLLGLVNPLLTQRLFDDAIGRANIRLLVTYVLIMTGAPIVSGLISVGHSYLNNAVGQNVMRDLRNQLYAHLQRMPMQFFTSTRAGELQSRLSNDINGVQTVINDTAVATVANLASLVSIILAMFFLSPALTIVSLCSLPFFIWITYKVGKTRRVLSKETQKSAASLAVIMQEMLSISGIILIKTFGRQKYAQEYFAKENQALANLTMRQLLIGRWLYVFVNVFYLLMVPIIYLIAGLQMIHHWTAMTFGTMVAFTTLQGRLFFPVGQLLNVQVEIHGAMALFERIFELLDLPIEIQDKPDAFDLKCEEVRGEICFEQVAFTYKREDPALRSSLELTEGKGYSQEHSAPSNRDLIVPPTLKNISLDIQPGQMVALVGPSGAGKTTMTYLISRLYDVEKGSVKIDGRDVRDIKLSSLSQLIGIVSQETYLFHASIRENLLYARQDASEDEMFHAAKIAAIHDRILELADGYDTIVGERGYKLSGGEKQRLSITRAILKNPRILILDEATSSLDTHSERLIQDALEPLMQGRTTIVIAHRLSTILRSDMILTLSKGEIVERGTHQELLKQQGLYAQLYREQFSQQVVTA